MDIDFPTNMAFAPDGRLFLAEKNSGRVVVARDGRVRPFAEFSVRSEAEMGMLGIALHPEFTEEPWVYVYYTAEDVNILARVRDRGGRGAPQQVLLRGLPARSYHNGGDITFGPDGKLYAVVGESHEPSLAQDPGSVGGKVLRLEPDGSIPGDNPFGGDSPVFSMGHRNSFGLCFDPETGRLWETENGPSGDDEVNLIRPGANHGWPEASGPGGGDRFVDPVIHFPQTIVPTGCAFYTAAHLGRRSEGALFFGDYGGTLWRAVPNGSRDGVREHERFVSGLDGITDVQMGPDQRLHVATQSGIVRLPAEVASPSPSPSPEESPEASPAAPPSPPSEEEGSLLPWLVAGAAAIVAASVAAGVAVRRRRGRPPGGAAPRG